MPRPPLHHCPRAQLGSHGVQHRGDGRVTLGRVTGAWVEAERYYALKATAKDTNLNRQGINGNFYLGRKSIGISRWEKGGLPLIGVLIQLGLW